MSSNETIKQAVMAGMGLSFISENTIGLELAVGHIVRLRVSGTPVMRQWNVVRRAGKTLLPLAEAFKQFLCKDGARLMRANLAATAIDRAG
jgi:DNA-binding transcriptional LysR family regulator